MIPNTKQVIMSFTNNLQAVIKEPDAYLSYPEWRLQRLIRCFDLVVFFVVFFARSLICKVQHRMSKGTGAFLWQTLTDEQKIHNLLLYSGHETAETKHNRE